MKELNNAHTPQQYYDQSFQLNDLTNVITSDEIHHPGTTKILKARRYVSN